MEEKIVIGFKVKSLSDKGVTGVKKNSKVPFLLKKLFIIQTKEKNNQIIFSLKLKEGNYRTPNGEVRKLVIKSCEDLILGIRKEMKKYNCEPNKDYELEVLYG